MNSHLASQCYKGWKQWCICTKRQRMKLSALASTVPPRRDEFEDHWLKKIKKKLRFSLQQNYFLGVVSALVQLCPGVAAGCSGYSVLGVIMYFQHALLIWDRCPKALSSSLLKHLWIQACSRPACALYFTLWCMRNHIRNLMSRLCFTSSFTLHSRSGGQALTEGSTDQHKWIQSSLNCQKKWAFRPFC